MSGDSETPDVVTEDTSWVEAVSKKKQLEKEQQVMLDIGNTEEDKSKPTRRLQLFLYLVVFACVVVIVALATNLSYSDKREGGEVPGAALTGTQDLAAKVQESASQENADKDSETQQRTDTHKSDSTKNAKELCLTHDCILAATQIIEGTDSTVDPCNNFYDFACGGWIKSRAIPSDRGSLASYGEVRDLVQLKLKGIFEEEIDEHETNTFKNLKKLYKSCLNEDLIEERNESVMYPLLRELGGWPLLGDGPGGEWNEKKFELVRVLLAILKYNNKPLIAPWAGMDDMNSSVNTLFIDQPRLGMPSRKYFLDPELGEKKEAYKTLIQTVAVMLGADETTIGDDVINMIQLETDLANITLPREERRDSTALYNPMTVQQLQENYTNIKSCWNIKFDWLEYLQGAMRIPEEPVEITAAEKVVLVSVKYFSRLWEVLSNHSARTITNYAIWSIVKNRVPNLSRKYRDVYQQYKKSITGSSASRDRWQECTQYVKNVNGMAVGRMFVERYFDERSRTEAEEMIATIREAFHDHVSEVTWMDDDMKNVAREKADMIAAAVGYPDYLMNDTILEEKHALSTMDADKYFENVLSVLNAKAKYYFKFLRIINDAERPQWQASPATVNAFYGPQYNQISFPAGILQPPYFHVGRPRSLNYGGLGFLVGHEITHGFDDQGRQYDKYGNLNNWWTPEADAMFKQQAQCIVDQYSQFVWEDAGLNVNGINTQGENIADNGGIKQAYKGYKRWQSAHDEPDLQLPGLAYTQEQLFFIGFAQTRCSMSRKDDAVNHILSGVHSPTRFRIIGSLRNMPEFAEVFHCPVNSSMNPEKKCVVW